MKNNIYIFLKPRLKTIDTILPLLLQLKKNNLTFYFVVPDKKTYLEIEKNLVIKDLINRIGFIINLKKINNFDLSKKIFTFFLKLISKNLKVILFDEPVGKKKFLKYLGKNLFICESDSYGNSLVIEKTKKIEKNTSPKHYFVKNVSLILFSKSWYNLDYFYSMDKNINIYNIGNPRLLSCWIDFINNNYENYLSNNLNSNYKTDQMFIVFILGVFEKDFGWDQEKKIMEHLFVDTINAIISIFPNIKIIFKPYSMTNIDTLHKLIKFTNCSNYEISYLHPFVLSKKCKFAIANSCSTVLADFKVNNVKTIEYSAYSKKLLNSTGNNSVQPNWSDYFINRDYKKLLDVIKSVKDNNFNQKDFVIENTDLNELNKLYQNLSK